MDRGRLEVDPETFPLSEGSAGRVALLRGYGNAIVPPLAAIFIRASDEAITEQEQGQ
jgi:DNA (cytosine-5)-methyltransferase 1